LATDEQAGGNAPDEIGFAIGQDRGGSHGIPPGTKDADIAGCTGL
jgi:hypothetical protein